MSELEIRYEVPEASRKEGDVETIVNAMGAYQAKSPFFVKQEIQVSEIEKGAVLARLVRTTLLESGLAYEFPGDAAGMRAGIEEHFPEESKDRLSKFFIGDDVVSEPKTPQS